MSPRARLAVKAGEPGAHGLVQPVLDGQEGADLAGDLEPGEHAVGAVAVDGCGGRATIAPVSFVVDAVPPAFLGADAGTLDGRSSERMVEPRRESKRAVRDRKKAPIRKGEPALVVGLGGPLGGARGAGRDPERPPPALLPGSQGKTFEGEGRSTAQALFVTAGDGDGGAGLDLLRFKTREIPEGMVLEVEAVDLLGNTARREWQW